ncbi:hypothetical protein ACFL44_01815 [Gemmatimonadota bacterium]
MTRSVLFLATFLMVMFPGHVNAQGTPARSSGAAEDRSWDTDPNGGRLFFAPTARITPSRRGAVTLYELILPTVSVTIHEDFILTAGVPLMKDIYGVQAWLVSGKYNLLTEGRTDAAIAALGFFEGSETRGFLYGVITIGDDDRSLTGGIGYSYVSSEHLFYETGDYTSEGGSFYIGGDLRLGPDLKLVSENHFLPGTDTLISLGIRFIGEKISVDLGTGMIRPERNPGFLPVIIVAWNW